MALAMDPADAPASPPAVCSTVAESIAADTENLEATGKESNDLASDATIGV